MKKTQTPKPDNDATTDMRPEYHFDYQKAKPNRFASRVGKKRMVVTLEPDVAEVFTEPETVNDVLRALIRTMPPTSRRKARA